MKKEFNQLVNDYAERIVNGKTIPKFERMSGAIEIESASAKSEADVRRHFNDSRVSTDYDPSIRCPEAFPHKVELHVKFENADIEHVLDVANQFANFTRANSASGIHIHLNLQALVGNMERASSHARLARFKPCFLADNERYKFLLYGMSGKRRRQRNPHVGDIKQSEFASALQLAKQSFLPPTLSDIANSPKYRLCQFGNANNRDYAPNKRTLESRAWCSSVGSNMNEYTQTSALHVESCFFVLFNLVSSSFAKMNKLDSLRFEPKHASAFESFKWFLHHCAKRSQLPIWTNKERVIQLIKYIFANCYDYDNEPK